jgi:hypothetical protein
MYLECHYLLLTSIYIYIKHDMHRYLVSAQNYISLLTVYEGNSTFIVPKVPAIEWGNAEDNSWYRGDNRSAITEYQVYKYFIILNNCAIQNYKL